MPTTLTKGNVIATPNENVTPAQTAAAQGAGWTTASQSSGGYQILPPSATYAIPGTNERTTNPDQANLAPVAPVAPNSPLPTVDQSNAQFMKDNPQYGYNGMNDPTVITPEMQSVDNNKFKQGLTAIKASGTPITDNAGQASGVVQRATQSINQDSVAPSVVGQIMETDKSFDSILTDYDKFHSTIDQKTSLVDQYTQLSKSLGIDAINTELLNERKIIDGTEDDIRLEIEKAGGFSTNSQVQALANARNKSLIQNYNYLLGARDNAMTQLGTMMNLTIQDRQMASAEFDRKMNYAFKVADYQQKAQSNAVEGFNNIVKNVGYDGLLAMLGGDQSAISKAEKTLGLSTGGLMQLASAPPSLDTQIKQANLRNINSQIAERDKKSANLNYQTPPIINPQTGRADPIANLTSVINGSGAKTDDKLKLTGAVIKAAQTFAQSNQEGTFEGLGPFTANRGLSGSLYKNLLMSSTGQQNRTYLAGLEGTVESWMTGASVSNDQAQRIKEELIPRNNDNNTVTRNKLNALTNYMLDYASGNLAAQGVNYSPERVDLFSNPIVVAPDYQEYEVTN